jgi:hypothetical protein
LSRKFFTPEATEKNLKKSPVLSSEYSVSSVVIEFRGLAQCKKAAQRSGGPLWFPRIDSVTYILTGEP